MANNKFSNIAYVDSTGEITNKKTLLKGFIVKCSHGSNNAKFKLSDNNSTRSYPLVFEYELPNGDKSKVESLQDMEISFQSGIKVDTISDAIVTLIYTEV